MLPIRGLGADETGFNRIVGWANILAFSVAVIGLVLLVLDRRKAPFNPSIKDLDTAADQLADEVLKQESVQRARMLGTDAANLTAADVQFERVDRLVRFEEAGSGRQGTLDGVSQYYREHTSGRLVILGEPGSGKTVLALELLVTLLELRRDAATDEKPAPVPVRLGLSAWNTDQPLPDWLAYELMTRFGMSNPLARRLVSTGRVLPILDGLDEMDPEKGSPVRATAAVSKLNEYLLGKQGAPLVVTCRSGDYARLTTSIRPAVEVRIRALTIDQIKDYLRHEIRHRDGEDKWQEWEDVLDKLINQHDDWVIEQLKTPWRLTLAVTFSRDGGSPRELLPPAAPEGAAFGPAPATLERTRRQYAAQVSDILLGAFIPARTRLYSDGDYTPEQTAMWLRNVAAHLDVQAREGGLSGSDIVLDQWWRIAGADRVRRWHGVIAAAVIILAYACLGVAVNGGIGEAISNVRYYVTNFPFLSRPYLVAGIFFVLGVIVVPYFVMQLCRDPEVKPAQLNLQQLRTHQGRRRLALGLAGGLAVGLAVGLAGGLAVGLASGLAGELAGGLAVVGLAVGLADGLAPIGLVATDPRSPLQNDRTVGLALGLAGGLAVGLASGLASGLAVGLAAGLANGLAVGLAAGLAWFRYAIAVSLATRDELIPLRFARFLHWSYQSGLLRISGNAYQFRHIELRNWLQQQQKRPR